MTISRSPWKAKGKATTLMIFSSAQLGGFAQSTKTALVYQGRFCFGTCEKVDRSAIRAGSPPEITSKLPTPTIQATSQLTTWPVPRSPVTASETDREAESDRHPKGDGIKW